MPFVSGKYVICAGLNCESTSLTTVRESWDEQDRIFVGEQRCDECGARMLYSRRPNTPQEIAMLKKKKPDTKPRTARKTPLARATMPQKRHTARATPSHRVNTVRPNGGLPESQEVAPAPVPIGEVMRLAVAELGAVTIDDDLAAGQLRELSECYEDVTRRRAAFTQKADEAKTAKKSLESATDLLLEKVRSFTHPKALPLFDDIAAENDQKRMEAV